jgi:hypothetical protein
MFEKLGGLGTIPRLSGRGFPSRPRPCVSIVSLPCRLFRQYKDPHRISGRMGTPPRVAVEIFLYEL